MIVSHVITLTGRATIVSMTLDFTPVEDVRQAWTGHVLERIDGSRWPILGVEGFAKLGAPQRSDGIGLLLPLGARVEVGDVVRVDPERCSARTENGRWCDRRPGHYPATLHSQYANGEWRSREDEDERLRGLR